MKRIALALVALLVVAAIGAAAYILTRPERVWTTSSEQARVEFEACLDNISRYYTRDAREHCARAVELDPDFVAAQIYLARYLPPEQRKEIVESLRRTDLDRLSPRERFLVRFALAREEGRHPEAREMLDAYLEEHPDDPHVLHISCRDHWDSDRWREAEACFDRLIETDPNRVEAHNLLGYMAMGRGWFDQAEDLFATYRYIAPDQANPHDSMGELLMLTGRYEEAAAEFDRALEIRADFCPAWQHRVETALLSGDLPTAREAAELTAERSACRPAKIQQTVCSVAIWEQVLADDWPGVRKAVEESCRTPSGDLGGYVSGEALVFAQRAALATGDLTEGRRLVEESRAFGEELEGRIGADHMGDGFQGLLAHLEGALALGEGKPRAAVEAFARADEIFAYWGQDGLGTFKLFNLVNLAAAQEAAGDSAAAAATLRTLDGVNPRFARVAPGTDWSLGTLPRTPPGTGRGSDRAPFSLGPAGR